MRYQRQINHVINKCSRLAFRNWITFVDVWSGQDKMESKRCRQIHRGSKGVTVVNLVKKLIKNSKCVIILHMSVKEISMDVL